MVEEKPEGEEIRVSRSEILVPSEDGPPTTMMYITYFAKGLPPGLLTLPKKEWTLEKETALIREDVKIRRKRKPTVVRI